VRSEPLKDSPSKLSRERSRPAKPRRREHRRQRGRLRRVVRLPGAARARPERSVSSKDGLHPFSSCSTTSLLDLSPGRNRRLSSTHTSLRGSTARVPPGRGASAGGSALSGVSGPTRTAFGGPAPARMVGRDLSAACNSSARAPWLSWCPAIGDPSTEPPPGRCFNRPMCCFTVRLLLYRKRIRFGIPLIATSGE
jgi:hypothetical protein